METQQADTQLIQGTRTVCTAHTATATSAATASAPTATSGSALASPGKLLGGGAPDSRLAPSGAASSRTGDPSRTGGPTKPRISTLCVMHVTPGHERAMARRVTRLAGSALNDCFTLQTEYRVRRHGAWRQELLPTFPSYLFLDVADPELLEQRLGLLSGHAQIPRVGERMAPLSSEDAATLRALGGADHVIRFSKGSVDNGELRVWRGALVGHEGLVRRIDRHKRCAWLRTGLGEGVMRVGLELTSKT